MYFAVFLYNESVIISNLQRLLLLLLLNSR